MALATKCPHCNTIFRVAADQLKLRGGIVRCGTCREVFDGNAALVDPAAASPFLTSASVPAAPLPTSYPADNSLPSATDDEPIYSLDFDTSFDPFGILPETAQLKDDADNGEHIELDLDVSLPAEVPADAPLELPAATAPEAPEPPLPQPMAPFKRRQVDDAPAFATYLRDSRREPNLETVATPAAPAEKVSLDKPAPARREPTFDDQPDTPQPAAPIAADPADDQEEPVLPPADDEPAFVTQGRRREQSGKALRVAMAAGSAVLLLLLFLQVMTTFRNPLAAQFPQWKPTLVALCKLSNCQVDLPAQIEALAIEQGELQTLKEQTFSYVSLLRNQSRSVQAWPSIELILNDANDKPVLRRVIAPRDYLPATIDVSKGFAPRSEQTIKLYFALDQLTASGYHIAIFYP
ncbi:zinc-ribbon domain-containing protein [Janthinobacterium lividum]|nr:zinc-ribbon domain-containing protein [Janthinobacterium lividum]